MCGDVGSFTPHIKPLQCVRKRESRSVSKNNESIATSWNCQKKNKLYQSLVYLTLPRAADVINIFLTLKIQRRPASVSQDSLYRAQQEGASSQVMVLTSLKKLKTVDLRRKRSFLPARSSPAGMLLPLPQLVSAPAQWTPSPLPSSENHSIDSVITNLPTVYSPSAHTQLTPVPSEALSSTYSLSL